MSIVEHNINKAIGNQFRASGAVASQIGRAWLAAYVAGQHDVGHRLARYLLSQPASVLAGAVQSIAVMQLPDKLTRASAIAALASAVASAELADALNVIDPLPSH